MTHKKQVEYWRNVRRHARVLMKFLEADDDTRCNMVINNEDLRAAISFMRCEGATDNARDDDKMVMETRWLYVDLIFRMIDEERLEFDKVFEQLTRDICRDFVGSRWSEYSDKLMSVLARRYTLGLPNAEELLRRAIGSRVCGQAWIHDRHPFSIRASEPDETFMEFLCQKHGIVYYNSSERFRQSVSALGLDKLKL